MLALVLASVVSASDFTGSYSFEANAVPHQVKRYRLFVSGERAWVEIDGWEAVQRFAAGGEVMGDALELHHGPDFLRLRNLDQRSVLEVGVERLTGSRGALLGEPVVRRGESIGVVALGDPLRKLELLGFTASPKAGRLEAGPYRVRVESAIVTGIEYRVSPNQAVTFRDGRGSTEAPTESLIGLAERVGTCGPLRLVGGATEVSCSAGFSLAVSDGVAWLRQVDREEPTGPWCQRYVLETTELAPGRSYCLGSGAFTRATTPEQVQQALGPCEAVQESLQCRGWDFAFGGPLRQLLRIEKR